MAHLTSSLKGLLLTLMLIPQAQTGHAGAVELHLTSSGGAEDRLLSLAGTTALRLLATAGVEAVWRNCTTGPCSEDHRRHRVLIHVLPIVKAHEPTVSGEFLIDARLRTPSILVFLARLAAVTAEIRRLPASRDNPMLSTIEVGHLVGLTIAHEVGHSLGLSHSDRGVMAARLSVREVVELRTSRLGFLAREASRLRVSLANHAAVVAAARD